MNDSSDRQGHTFKLAVDSEGALMLNNRHVDREAERRDAADSVDKEAGGLDRENIDRFDCNTTTHAQLLLKHKDLEHLGTPSMRRHFYVLIEGLRDGGEPQVQKILLPTSLAGAHVMDFHAWNAQVQDVCKTFAGLLTEDQLDTIKTLAYVYIWFSRQAMVATTGNEHSDVPALWAALQELLLTAIIMGSYLGTPGEDLIQNVQQWARSQLRVCGVYRYKDKVTMLICKLS
ncbi:hypothetical protein TRAPUB_1840 [Trametes pubescens]|uniref:Uncharacterized protein n=1 Tax=Trametes pubescens TaxID=154538 RepID=A0A1M2VI86_TRAPU|nr:hypothetical protein TRAPUB_1840 [Trametes pubescens]